ncbi:MAG TPA: hypothetical protein VMT27_02870 [Actinomycetes bacterium]|nr:hypothetical protein [Actinomycetes bacterium]
MSIVSVHGPYTFGSRAVTQNASGSVRATVDPTNGLIWTLVANDQSQPAANYDWAYTGASTAGPTSPIADTKNPAPITFVAGAHTITLTLNGVAQPPLNITAVAGTGGAGASLRSLPPDGGDGEEPPPEGGDVQVGYDPGAHTVTEVIGFVEDNPDQLEAVLAAEQAGKDRITLVQHLEGMRSES